MGESRKVRSGIQNERKEDQGMHDSASSREEQEGLSGEAPSVELRASVVFPHEGDHQCSVEKPEGTLEFLPPKM